MKTRPFTVIVTRSEMRDILQRARLPEVLAARAALAERLAAKRAADEWSPAAKAAIAKLGGGAA